LTPDPPKAGAARPRHEEDSPAAIVWVLPKVVESEIKKDVFHKLDELKAEAEFTLV
jgi:hypothetical protein